MGWRRAQGGPAAAAAAPGPPQSCTTPHGPLGVGRISAELSQHLLSGVRPLVLVLDDQSDHQAVRQPASLRVRLTPR